MYSFSDSKVYIPVWDRSNGVPVGSSNFIDPVPNLLQLYLFAGYKGCCEHYALLKGGSSTVNLIERFQTTSSQRWVEIKCFLHEFRVVGLCWTFSNLFSSGNRNSSMRFKRIKLHRTFLNYIFTEIARYKDFFSTSLGWFNWTTRVWSGLTWSNLFWLHLYRR